MKASHKELLVNHNNAFIRVFSTNSICSQIRQLLFDFNKASSSVCAPDCANVVCRFLLSVELWCNMSAGINIAAWLHSVHADQCRSGAEACSAPVGLGMSATSTRSSLPSRCFFFLFSLHWKGKRREATHRARRGMGSMAALRTVLVLGLVTGLAGCAPGLNGTADCWEALYSRSLARLPGEKREEISRDGDYLLGIKRLRRLYCNVGIGFHIQVLPDGRITGVHNENRHSKLCLRLLDIRSWLFIFSILTHLL